MNMIPKIPTERILHFLLLLLLLLLTDHSAHPLATQPIMGFKNLFNRKTNKIAKDKTNAEKGKTLRSPVDGKISSSELGSIMGSLGHPSTEEELENMIKEVDGDGFIDLNEFIDLNTKGIDSTEVLENLKDAFSVFDVDRSGSITADELQNVLGSLGEDCSITECRKMIAGVDQDGDGMISFHEFKVMMMNGSRQ